MRPGWWLALLCSLATPGLARAQGPDPALPSLAELQAAGARIGSIRIVAEDVFDTRDPREDRWLFRWANRLHIQTQPGVIERALLFKTGDLLSTRVLEETERLLRSNRYLYDVRIRVLAVADGVVDLEVVTRDTWSIDPGLSAGRSGGATTSGVHLREYNLLGSGVSLSLGRSREVDRSGSELLFSNERAFGSWTALAYSHATNSDGRRDAASVVRPFYALDTRWAAGLSALRDDRIESVYQGGQAVSQFRHQRTQGEAFAGLSSGLVNGWVSRWSLGLSLQDDTYAAEPGRRLLGDVPPDQRRVAPFVRAEWLEDRFERELNRNLVGRPEFFALGLAARLQIGRAMRGLGSTEDGWLVSASMSRGFEPLPDQTLMLSSRISGHWVQGQVQREQVGMQAQFYVPQGRRWLFYAAAAMDAQTRPPPQERLLLGGDNGLRGYPLRWQTGTRRALFTLEERFYTDVYPWRLFRIGGAAFADAGRAWGGGELNPQHPGWQGDVGAGLRIVSARSAFSNVLHVDLAMPLTSAPDLRRLQLLVKTRASF